MIEKTVEATVDEIAELTDFAEDFLDGCGASMKMKSQIAIAIDEIFNNIASYAYPDGKGQATFAMDFDETTKTVKLIFTDSGIRYDPLAKDDPDVTLSAEDRQIGGLGIFMVKKLMDRMEYVYENGKNVLTLEKILNA